MKGKGGLMSETFSGNPQIKEMTEKEETKKRLMEQHGKIPWSKNKIKMDQIDTEATVPKQVIVNEGKPEGKVVTTDGEVKDFTKPEQPAETPEKPIEVTVEGDQTERQKRLDRIKNLEADIQVWKDKLPGGANEYPPAYHKMVENTVKNLETILAEEKAKLEKNPSDEVKKVEEDIKLLQNMLERDDAALAENKYTPEQRKILEDALAEKKARLKDAQEIFMENETTPESIQKQEIIKKVTMMAANPRGDNFFKDNRRIEYTKDEIKGILEKEPDPTKRAELLKTHLIDSLDSAINLRNEAKYGTGFMGKFRKFMNEGWGGALTKTAAGAGLIAGGLSGVTGLLSPALFGAGLKMAAEGITQVGQEIKEAVSKKSRRGLMEVGKLELAQKIDAQMKKLESEGVTDPERYSREMMEFIDKTYANEVKTLVDKDTEHIRKAERLRRIMGWAGTAIGVLGGMPMDSDVNGVAHVVNFLGHSWSGGGLHHILAPHILTHGDIANYAAFGLGTAATYLFNRNGEGDYKPFELKIETTKNQADTLKDAQKKEKDYISKNLTPEEQVEFDKKRGIIHEPKPTVGGKTKEETLDTAEKIVIDKEKEKSAKLSEKIKEFYKTDIDQLGREAENPKNESDVRLVANLNLLSRFNENISITEGPSKEEFAQKTIAESEKMLKDNPNLDEEAKNIIRDLIADLKIISRGSTEKEESGEVKEAITDEDRKKNQKILDEVKSQPEPEVDEEWFKKQSKEKVGSAPETELDEQTKSAIRSIEYAASEEELNETLKEISKDEKMLPSQNPVVKVAIEKQRKMLQEENENTKVEPILVKPKEKVKEKIPA